MNITPGFLDAIVWGNPSWEDVQNRQVRNYLFSLLPELIDQPPFLNSSSGTLQELHQLKAYTAQQETSARRQVFDTALVPYLDQLMVNNGCDPEEVQGTTGELVRDLLPLITELKYTFQRPRPFQLAYYLGIDLYPGFSKFAGSPSYPSGHTVLCTVIAEVLSTHYATSMPGCPKVLQQFTGEVMESRLYMGVHYASDNRFALKVARSVINHPEFRQKYQF